LTLPGLEPQPLSRPARSQTLYQVRYPGSPINDDMKIISQEIIFIVTGDDKEKSLYRVPSRASSWFALQ
jgi:hypothetical protein